MRLMDGISMMLPSVYEGRRAAEEGNDAVLEEGIKVGSPTEDSEMSSTGGTRELKRRREDEANNHSLLSILRSRSGESGAEADSEGSCGQTNVNDSSGESSPENQILGNDIYKGNEDGEGGSQKSRPKTWVDRSMEDSGSGSTASRSSASSTGRSTQTSGEGDSDGKEGSREQVHWNPTSAFEHERWQKHHCPPGATTTRLQLPSTGAFIWTAEAGGSVHQSSSMSKSRLMDTGEPDILDGANLYGQQSTSSQVQHSGGRARYNPHLLPAGIHKEKYTLVELGPGVGIRGVDTFTEAAGRKSSYDLGDKGKGYANTTDGDVLVDGQGLSIVARGVAYHVPVSAYPVGSTAMTIGGFGYLCRAYGLSLDNLVEIELVLADGRVMVLNHASVTASKDEADLWWAARGAAPCFGVVTRLVAKAYPVPTVYAGNLIFPFNPATAPSLICHWRDCLKGTGDSIPRELYSNLILTAGPPSGSREHVIIIQVCFLGTSSADDIGHSFIQAICSWTGERVLLKDVMERSFLEQQDSVAQVLKSGEGRRWMVRSDLISTLTDDVIYKTVDKFYEMRSSRAIWFFELIGGAVGDEKETCVGEEQRSAKFTVAALQQWNDAIDDEKCLSTVDSWVQDVLGTVSVGGPFACFLERNESKERCQGSFGKENFARLLEIKRRIDPDGLFRHTFADGLTAYV